MLKHCIGSRYPVGNLSRVRLKSSFSLGSKERLVLCMLNERRYRRGSGS